MDDDMYYWYGWRVFDKELDSEPTRNILSIPCATYKEAKQERERLNAHDIEITSIFQADSRRLAEEKMEQEEFKNF